MSSGKTASTGTTTRRARCVHHWVIDSPSGRASRGVCRNCGRSKSFANSTESVMWEQTNTLRSDMRSPIRIPRPKEITLSDEQ